MSLAEAGAAVIPAQGWSILSAQYQFLRRHRHRLVSPLVGSCRGYYFTRRSEVRMLITAAAYARCRTSIHEDMQSLIHRDLTFSDLSVLQILAARHCDTDVVRGMRYSRGENLTGNVSRSSSALPHGRAVSPSFLGFRVRVFMAPSARLMRTYF